MSFRPQLRKPKGDSGKESKLPSGYRNGEKDLGRSQGKMEDQLSSGLMGDQFSFLYLRTSAYLTHSHSQLFTGGRLVRTLFTFVGQASLFNALHTPLASCKVL